MPEDQVNPDAESSEEGPLGNAGTTEPTDDSSSETHADEAAGGTAEDQTPTVEERVAALEAERIEFEQKLQRANEAFNEQKSRADRAENQLKPYVEREIKDNPLFTDEGFQKRVDEVGVAQTVREVNEATMRQRDIANAEEMERQRSAVQYQAAMGEAEKKIYEFAASKGLDMKAANAIFAEYGMYKDIGDPYRLFATAKRDIEWHLLQQNKEQLIENTVRKTTNEVKNKLGTQVPTGKPTNLDTFNDGASFLDQLGNTAKEQEVDDLL